MPKKSALEKYVDEKNILRSMFGQSALVIFDERDAQTIAGCLDTDLSPEVLTRDGERPAAQVRTRYRFLVQAATELKARYPGVSMYHETA